MPWTRAARGVGAPQAKRRSGARGPATNNGRDVSDDRRGARVPPGQFADGVPADQGRQDSGRARRPPVALPQARHRRLARQPAAARRRRARRRLPTTPAPAAAPGAPNARAFSSWTTKSSIRDLLAKTLALADYDVDTAADGRSALERLRLYPYDLLIADLKMPGIDGLSVIREAKRLKADLPVIIITGYSTETGGHRSGESRRVRLPDETVPRSAGAGGGRESHRGTRLIPDP